MKYKINIVILLARLKTKHRPEVAQDSCIRYCRPKDWRGKDYKDFVSFKKLKK